MKAKDNMPAGKIHARLVVDQKATLILERMADMEGRDKQRNLGIILERVARAFESDPDKLVELGIITSHVASAA